MFCTGLQVNIQTQTHTQALTHTLSHAYWHTHAFQLCKLAKYDDNHEIISQIDYLLAGIMQILPTNL